MTFTEQPFLVLLLVTYALWLLCRGRYRLKLLVLLTASLTFYAYHAWPLVFLILPTIFIVVLVPPALTMINGL